MRRAALLLCLSAAAFSMLSCEEISLESKDSTFVVDISVGGSPFLAAGDSLVGDTVQFSATVREDGQPFPASGERYTSSVPSVVRIISAGEGTAVFLSVGDATVTVTFDEPELQGAEKLTAQMDLSITEYTVELSLESVRTGAAVDSADGLVDDTVRALAEVRKDGALVSHSGLKVESSTNPSVAQPVLGQDDLVAYGEAGTARLFVTFDQPNVPGDEPLGATINVTVKPFTVELDVESLVQGSTSLADGDTLVTDSVRFTAVVQVADGTVPTTGADWVSSAPGVVRIVDSAAGTAVFDGVGTAVVSVTFQDPKLPGEPFGMDVRVTTLVAAVQVESNITGPGVLADTLLTDSVTFSATIEKDGQPWTGGAVSVTNTESTDSSIVEIVDGAIAKATFADTGQAQVILTLAEPRLPRAPLIGNLPLRVTTYLAEVSQVSPDTVPAMGDDIDYDVVVTRTRDNTTVPGPSVTFSSSDPSVIEIVTPATGAAFARDTGQSVVSVTVNNPSLPAGAVSDALPATDIVHERFYGIFSAEAGNFGDTPGGDSVTVESSAVHFFTDSTRVEFPNGTVGFVESVKADSLVFLVPAAATSGHLVLRNLEDDGGGFRDNVQTRVVFTGPGAGAVNDFYEPNDAFPLTAAVKMAPPFEALLSWDPSKSAPADTNFFYMVLNPGATLDFVAEWEQDADLDFKICSGNADPPTDYLRTGGVPICQRVADSANRESEQVLGETLSAGIYVVAFYCKTNECPVDLPLTYKVRIE